MDRGAPVRFIVAELYDVTGPLAARGARDWLVALVPLILPGIRFAVARGNVCSFACLRFLQPSQATTPFMAAFLAIDWHRLF